ncbi:MAG: hypothetical protein ABIS86_17905 [Streptosporangiaceae bacterium]
MRLFRPPPGPRRCLQCGRPGVDVIGVGARRVRYSCGRCGAVVTSRRSELPGPERAADGDPLTAVMTVPMARWLRREHPGADLALPADRTTIERWYSEFDQFVQAACGSPSVRARFEEISEAPPRPVLDFPRTVTALMTACFDVEVALRRLPQEDAVRERMEHARNWVATGGLDSTWLGGRPALETDPEVARRLLEPGALTGRFDRARSIALSRALFGVDRCPQVRLLVEQFSEQCLQEWIGVHLSDGSRPLRDRVLASLAAAR